MRQFLCINCKLLLTVADDQIGHQHLCFNCNTRQTVPYDATIIVDSPPALPGSHGVIDYASRIPRNYTMRVIAGWILWIGGILGVIAAVFWTISSIDEWPRTQNGWSVILPLSCILNGFVAMGRGQLLLCTRDIARKVLNPAHT